MRRSGPAALPWRFYSGNKAREARPLIRHLTSRRGFVCVSADYRLQPHVTLADQVADVRDAIAWVRAHAASSRARYTLRPLVALASWHAGYGTMAWWTPMSW